ncbi:MAG: hypothetical protein JST75_06880 [Bacteroidetes bacterium]|nr:hypothetical protein [Bacteroidota bacterium]
MKHKYINTVILMACLSKSIRSKKDIHSQIQETIAERNKIMQEWGQTFFAEPVGEKDIHQQLRETIQQHKKIMNQLGKLFAKDGKVVVMADKQAA